MDCRYLKPSAELPSPGITFSRLWRLSVGHISFTVILREQGTESFKSLGMIHFFYNLEDVS